MVEGESWKANKGTPQGAVLSPLLANIYLNELYYLIGEKYRMVRYADDGVPRRRIGGRSPPCSYAA